MLLYLLRHADADTYAANDDDRILSEKGVAQAQRVASFCRERALIPRLVLASPLIRARQTAEYFISAFPGLVIQVCPFLASGMTADSALRELRPYASAESVMIVGHEPDFSELAARLVGMTESRRFRVRKASLTLLNVSEFAPRGATLEFSLPCKLM